MGIENKQGRLVVFIARNSDLGDAWEWINDSRYPVNTACLLTRSVSMWSSRDEPLKTHRNTFL